MPHINVLKPQMNFRFVCLQMGGDPSDAGAPSFSVCGYGQRKDLRLWGRSNQRGMGSISPTFYARLFCTKVLFEAFLYLQFGFVTFFQKDISAKAARKMLMKMATVVNFTNVLQAAFTQADPKSTKRH